MQARNAGSLQITRQSVTLRQRIYDKLRHAIIHQQLPPGTKLVERDLCEQLGVSRPSLREALRHLESEKLIEMVPHKGSVVATLALSDVLEIYDVRAALEGLACEKFAKLATDQDIELLQQAFAHLGQALDQDDHDAILQAKATFYEVIFRGSQSEISQSLVASLNVRIEILRRTSMRQKDRNRRMTDAITSIVDAAVKRDGAAMKASCIAHIEGAKDAAIEQLEAMKSGPSLILAEPHETTTTKTN